MLTSVYYSIISSKRGAIKLPKTLPYEQLHEKFSSKIAVVIPTRNEEKNIVTVLESMLNQKFTNFTVIVTDRSSDTTLGVAKRFFDQHKERFEKNQITLTLLPWDNTKNYPKGRIGQFEHAFSILPPSIEYIGYADADAEYNPDWLFCLAFGINSGYDLVSSGFSLSRKEKISDIMDDLDNQFATITGQSAMNAGIRGWMFGASVLYKREVFEEIHGYDRIENVIMDDNGLAQKFFWLKKKVGYFNDRRTRVKVAPVSSPIKQKVRWSSANWTNSDVEQIAMILGINFIPVLLYLVGIIAVLLDLLIPQELASLGISFNELVLSALFMFLLDLQVVIYLFYYSNAKVKWLLFYLLWINIIARPIVVYSFFKRHVNWKEEPVLTITQEKNQLEGQKTT